LPALHSQELLRALDKLAKSPKKLGQLQSNYIGLEMFARNQRTKR
jgi:hypothetical protein